MKGEDTKESWCRWSCQAERRRSSKHRNRGGGLRGVYHKFLFLCYSASNLFQVHMVVENLGATGDIPDEGECGRLMTIGRDTSGEGVRTML